MKIRERADSAATNALSAILGPFGVVYGIVLGDLKIVLKYKTVDVLRIGGMYTKVFKVRKLIQKQNDYYGLYQYGYATVYYKKSSLREKDVVYASIVDSGPYQLDRIK